MLVKMTMMDTITLDERKAAFKKLLEVGNLAALSEKERAQYECNLKHYRVYMNQLDYAEKKGIEEGREKGKKEGREESLLQTAIAMKLDGMDGSLISRYTGLTLAQIDAL